MSEAAPQGSVTPLRKPLSTDAGGATVDVSRIGSLRFAAGTRELDEQFKKGDDVLVVVVARVTGVPVRDKYDSHGNISETSRNHELRVDEVQEVRLLQAGAARTAAQAQAEDEQIDGQQQLGDDADEGGEDAGDDGAGF